MDRRSMALAALALLVQAGSSRAVDFAFNFDPAVPADMARAVEMAGLRWSEAFADPIVIRIDVDLGPLQPGWLAQTRPTVRPIPYDRARDALARDATSRDDALATAQLQAGDRMRLLLNRTSTNPSGAGSAAFWLDEDGDGNNAYLRPSTANLKALGQTFEAGLVDGRITLNPSVAWDMDDSDGIAAGAYDLAGIAAHEIAHVMGFNSGVEYLEAYPSLADSSLAYVTVMDLFRFSEESAAQGAPDWTADARGKYLSIDGGVTRLGALAAGSVFGDGRQVSHWRSQDALMDPAVARGESPHIAEIDLRALDAIGYDRQDAIATTVGSGGGLPVIQVAPGQTLRLEGDAVVAGQLRMGLGALIDPGEAGLILRGGDDPAAVLAQLDLYLAHGDDPLRIVAVILNREPGGSPLYSAFHGVAVGGDDVLAAVTWAGDMDLDGRVSGRDYELLQWGMSMGLGGYAGGDLNGDGLADGDDYYLIDQSWMSQPAELPAPGLGITVPEPGMALLGAVGAALFTLRRQRTATRIRSVLESRR